MAHGADEIIALVRKHAASGTTDLPLFDRTGLRLHQLTSDCEFDLGEAERLVASDAALAAEVLRLANSSHFRGLEKTLSVGDAIMRLGIKELVNLVLLIGNRKAYRLQDPNLARYVEDLWRHAVSCAAGCHWLVGKLRRPDLAPTAFLTGLLHDVGKLFVLRVLDDMAPTTRAPLVPAAPELMASLHHEEGARLLEKWNLPEEIHQVVRHHHDEICDPGDLVGMSVRLTDLVCNAKGIGLNPTDADAGASQEAQTLGVPPAGIEALGRCVEHGLELALR